MFEYQKKYQEGNMLSFVNNLFTSFIFLFYFILLFVGFSFCCCGLHVNSFPVWLWYKCKVDHSQQPDC